MATQGNQKWIPQIQENPKPLGFWVLTYFPLFCFSYFRKCVPLCRENHLSEMDIAFSKPKENGAHFKFLLAPPCFIHPELSQSTIRVQLLDELHWRKGENTKWYSLSCNLKIWSHFRLEPIIQHKPRKLLERRLSSHKVVKSLLFAKS